MNNEKLEKLLETLLEVGYQIELRSNNKDFKCYAIKDKGYYVFLIYQDKTTIYYRLCDFLATYIDRYTEDFINLLGIVNHYL